MNEVNCPTRRTGCTWRERFIRRRRRRLVARVEVQHSPHNSSAEMERSVKSATSPVPAKMRTMLTSEEPSIRR